MENLQPDFRFQPRERKAYTEFYYILSLPKEKVRDNLKVHLIRMHADRIRGNGTRGRKSKKKKEKEGKFCVNINIYICSMHWNR